MAGLPGTSAWVCVGPPLKASTGLRMLLSWTPAGGTISVGPGVKPYHPGVAVEPKRLLVVRL